MPPAKTLGGEKTGGYVRALKKSLQGVERRPDNCASAAEQCEEKRTWNSGQGRGGAGGGI